MTDATEVAVTLTPALFAHLSREAARLDVPIEWLVAALIADTVGDDLQLARRG
jgi:hypothetical protein